MKRQTLDKIKCVRFLNLYQIIKKWLRFYYHDEINSVFNGLKRIQKNTISTEDIRKFQSIKLKDLCIFAYEKCEYYKEIFNKVRFNAKSLENFTEIPTLDKKLIRGNVDKLVVKNLMPWQFYEMNTGGSTGEPLQFKLSPKVGIIDDVHQEYQLHYIGYRKGDLIVSLSGNSISKDYRKRNIFWEDAHQNPFFGKRKYSSLYINKNTLKFYVEDLLTIKPKFVRSYPSAIYEIANFMNKNNIKATFKVKGIILTSEQTYSWQLEVINKAFKTNIYFQLGHSEACLFAYTLDDSFEYLCSPFYGKTEILDKKGRHVEKGASGEIVVTGFYNYAMPFIRYRTGDVAVYKGEKNGIVRLGKIQGRTQDYVFDSKGNQISLTALIFGQHYKAFKNIQKWQLIQSKKGEILIKIIKDRDFSLDNEEEIRRKFYDIARISVNFRYVRQIPLTKRGKYVFLIQKLNNL